MLILEEKLFCRFILISYITKTVRKRKHLSNRWCSGTIQHSKWFALRKQISVHTKRALEAENPLFDKTNLYKTIVSTQSINCPKYHQ